MRKNPKVSWMDVRSPKIDKDAFVDPRAEIIGDVRIGKHVYVAPFAVLRADEGSPIIIGDRSNVQDGVIVHALKNSKVKIGKEVSLAHGCIVHGEAEIEDNSFIGFRAIVLRSKIGKECFVGHGAIVVDSEIPNGKYVPHGCVIENSTDLKDISKEQREFIREVVEVNVELAKAYKKLD